MKPQSDHLAVASSPDLPEQEGAAVEPDDWQLRDEQHANDPQRGDYWQEMLSPCFVILGRIGNRVLFCDKTKATDRDHWTWDLDGDGVKLLSVDDFKKRLSYGTIPGFWCHVMPGRHKGIADYFDAQAARTAESSPGALSRQHDGTDEKEPMTALPQQRFVDLTCGLN